MALDGITLKALAFELSQKLTGGKIDKISQAEKDEILFTIRVNQQNCKLLISANSANPRIYLTGKYNKENPLQAPMFLMLLRKHLGGGRISSIHQQGLDRSLFVEIDAFDELRQPVTRVLSIEIMGKHSNIILFDKKSNLIIDSIKRVPLTISSIREVLPQREFQPAPTQGKINPLESIELKEFIRIIKQKSQPVFNSLYTNFEGMSPTSAREIAYMSNINDSLGTYELNDLQSERLKNSFDRLMTALRNNQFYPCIAFQKNGTPKDFSGIMLTHLEEDYLVKHETSISHSAEEYFYQKDIQERIAQKIQGLRKSIQIKADRVRTKMQKQIDEINEAKNLEEFAKIGELLTANIYQLSKGLESIDVIDYTNESMPQITIALNQHLSPSENIQAYYKKYNKSKARIKELTYQLTQTKEELDYLDNVITSINNIDTLDAIEDIRLEMAQEGYYSYKPAKQQKKKEASQPIEYISSDGVLILVGKNNIQNDQLTMKISSPNDVWLHTKNIPGSHVIAKATFEDISKETLYEAALLAAYYSKSRASSQVPVDYAPRKNVRKPSGSRPGMVIYDDYGTIYVTPDENRLPKRLK